MTLIFAMAPLGASFADEAAPEEDNPFIPTYFDYYGEFEGELTLFPKEGQHPEQQRLYGAVALQPSMEVEWLDGDARFKSTTFIRFDPQDPERNHIDPRELKFDFRLGDAADLTIGADTVFWGKTEALHLVDIINQTDGVEGQDGEDKLGQPMVALQYLTDEYGEFSAYYLPYFRERNFPGPAGRLRGSIVVDDDDARYGTGAEEWTPGFAARWAHFIGDFDLGLSAFHGLSREPSFVPKITPSGLRLAPFYDRITQVGFDGQYTSGPALWKLEALYRHGQLNLRNVEEDYVAFTGGVEYTLYGVMDSNADLGLIAEYAFDQRGKDAPTLFQNDAILGLRLGLNDADDTAILGIAAVDVETGGTTLQLEASTRLTEAVTAEIEAGAFIGHDRADLAFDLRDDHFIRLKLAYHW